MKQPRPRLVLARTTVRALSRTDLAAVVAASADCDSKGPPCSPDTNASAMHGKEHVECFTAFA